MAGHFLRLGQLHQVEHGGGQISEDTFLQLDVAIPDRNQAYRQRGVGSESATSFRIDHLLGITMVSRDQGNAALGQDRVDNLAGAGINGFDGRNRCFEDARMADHVAVGEIEDDDIIFA